MINPILLVEIEARGTERERTLVRALREAQLRCVQVELLTADLRLLLRSAIEIESGPGDEPEEEAVDRFVAKARSTVDNASGQSAYLLLSRFAAAAQLAATTRSSREYYVELAREVLDLPAKDGAARALARRDVQRIVMEGLTMVNGLMFDAKYTESKTEIETPDAAPTTTQAAGPSDVATAQRDEP